MTDAEKPKRRRGAPWFVWVLPALLLIVLPTANHFFLFQLFRQPSGSMQPTLHTGDIFAVSKWAYGYSSRSFMPFGSLVPEGHWFARAPQRGDIVVFEPLPEPGRAFVKRIVGLPGDRIQMIGGVLHINGEAVRQEDLGGVNFTNEDGYVEQIPAIRETLPNGVSYTVFNRDPNSPLDNTREYFVPEGSVFVMGDDRDNSADSRVPSIVGSVPLNHLIGRVDHVLTR